MSYIVRAGNGNHSWIDEPKPVYRLRNGWEDLANAIIVQAAADYRTALRNLKKRPDNFDMKLMKLSCESFFLSWWCEVLTNADPVMIMLGIRKEEEAA